MATNDHRGLVADEIGSSHGRRLLVGRPPTIATDSGGDGFALHGRIGHAHVHAVGGEGYAPEQAQRRQLLLLFHCLGAAAAARRGGGGGRRRRAEDSVLLVDLGLESPVVVGAPDADRRVVSAAGQILPGGVERHALDGRRVSVLPRAPAAIGRQRPVRGEDGAGPAPHGAGPGRTSEAGRAGAHHACPTAAAAAVAAWARAQVQPPNADGGRRIQAAADEVTVVGGPGQPDDVEVVAAADADARPVLDVGDGAAGTDQVPSSAETAADATGAGRPGVDEDEGVVAGGGQVGSRRRPPDRQDGAGVGGQGAQQLVPGPRLDVGVGADVDAAPVGIAATSTGEIAPAGTGTTSRRRRDGGGGSSSGTSSSCTGTSSSGGGGVEGYRAEQYGPLPLLPVLGAGDGHHSGRGRRRRRGRGRGAGGSCNSSTRRRGRRRNRTSSPLLLLLLVGALLHGAAGAAGRRGRLRRHEAAPAVEAGQPLLLRTIIVIIVLIIITTAVSVGLGRGKDPAESPDLDLAVSSGRDEPRPGRVDVAAVHGGAVQFAGGEGQQFLRLLLLRRRL